MTEGQRISAALVKEAYDIGVLEERVNKIALSGRRPRCESHH